MRIVGKHIKVPAFIVERLRPWRNQRAMSRNHDLGGQLCQAGQQRQPPDQAAVHHRQMLQKHQIARVQHAGGLIEHGQVAGGVSRRPRGQKQPPAAQVERGLVIDQQGRRDDFDLGDGRGAKLLAERAQIVSPALRQLGRQVVVSDKGHIRNHALRKGSVAKHMVRMLMGVDHVTDRLVGDAANGQQQALPDADAATGVDHGDGVASDDDAKIGDVALVLGRGHGDLPEMHVITLGHALHQKRRAIRRCREAGAGNQERPQDRNKTGQDTHVRHDGHLFRTRSGVRSVAIYNDHFPCVSRPAPADHDRVICGASERNIALAFDNAISVHGWERGRSPGESAWVGSEQTSPDRVVASSNEFGLPQTDRRKQKPEETMRSASAGLLLTAGTVLASCLTIAAAIAQPATGDDLVKMQTNAANVVMPTITYDAQRYSKLNQITAEQCRQAAGGVDILHRCAARP